MSLTVDLSRLQRAFAKFNFETRAQAAQLIREQGRGLAMELAQKTQPATFQDGSGVGRNFEKKIGAEVGRVYKPVPFAVKAIASHGGRRGRTRTQNPQQAARAFAFLARRAGQAAGISSAGKRDNRGRYIKKSAKAATRRVYAETATQFLQRLNVEPFIRTTVGQMDQGQQHERVRFGKYRRVPKNQYVKIVPLDGDPLERYVRRKQAHAGLTKAGWAQAARQLGGDHPFRSRRTVTLPRWVKRHTKAAGYALDNTKDPEKPNITVANTIPWISSVLSSANLNDTLLYRKMAMVSRMKYVLRQAIKEAGL